MYQGPGDYHMTVRVDLPDGNISAPISNKLLVKYATAGEMKTKHDMVKCSLSRASFLSPNTDIFLPQGNCFSPFCKYYFNFEFFFLRRLFWCTSSRELGCMVPM